MEAKLGAEYLDDLAFTQELVLSLNLALFAEDKRVLRFRVTVLVEAL